MYRQPAGRSPAAGADQRRLVPESVIWPRCANGPERTVTPSPPEGASPRASSTPTTPPTDRGAGEEKRCLTHLAWWAHGTSDDPVLGGGRACRRMRRGTVRGRDGRRVARRPRRPSGAAQDRYRRFVLG